MRIIEFSIMEGRATNLSIEGDRKEGIRRCRNFRTEID